MDDDDSWRGLEMHERVKWARQHSRFQFAKNAAESLGIPYATYSGYEREPGSSKSIALNHQSAARLAKKFKVRWEWLLTGEGEPWLTPRNEPIDQDPLRELFDELRRTRSKAQQVQVVEALKVLLGRTDRDKG